jgi:hypothetical protein
MLNLRDLTARIARQKLFKIIEKSYGVSGIFTKFAVPKIASFPRKELIFRDLLVE